MKRLSIILVPLLLLSVVVVLFTNKARQDRQLYNQQIVRLKKEVSDLGAEKMGLQQANNALHSQLELFRAAPPRVRPSDDTGKMEIDQAALEVQAFDDVNEYPGPPTTLPSISPQLRKMMEQFPGQVSENSISKSNTIQDYFDANPQIVEERSKPTSKYGAGIESVMEAYPDLAEKVKKNEALSHQ